MRLAPAIGAVLAGVAAAVYAPAGAAQIPAPATLADTDSTPWHVGERLEYGVKFGFISIGHSSLDVLGIDSVRGEPCWHVQFIFHAGVLGYSLDDSLQSWFGVKDLVSRRFHQDDNENGRRHVRHYEIFPDRMMWIRNESDSGATPADPLDETSFFFFARSRTLEPGEQLVMNRYFQKEHNPVTLQVLQRQNVSVPAGHYAAVVIRPIFQSGGLFGRGGKALIWFSDDAARVPIRIRSSLPVGSLDMSLRSRS